MEGKMDKDAQAREMFEKGYSIHTVAERLGVEFKVAKQWKQDWEAANKRREFDLIEKAYEEQQNTTAETEDDTWSLSIQVPASKFTEIFANFTTQEQADAIATVLQNRVNAQLGVNDLTGVGHDTGAEATSVQ